MNTEDIPAELRDSLGDGAPTETVNETFTEWMNRHTPEEQARMFGAERVFAWSEGKMTQANLIAQRGHGMSLPQFTEQE